MPTLGTKLKKETKRNNSFTYWSTIFSKKMKIPKKNMVRNKSVHTFGHIPGNKDI